MRTFDQRTQDGHNQNGADEKSDGASEELSADEKADLLTQDVERLRDNLDRLVEELDRRRHQAFDLRLQARRHQVPLLIGAAVLVAGGGVAWALHRRRQRQRLSARAERLRRAVARIIERPDRVAPRERGIVGKLLMAGAGAAVAVLARKLTERAVGRT